VGWVGVGSDRLARLPRQSRALSTAMDACIAAEARVDKPMRAWDAGPDANVKAQLACRGRLMSVDAEAGCR